MPDAGLGLLHIRNGNLELPVACCVPPSEAPSMYQSGQMQMQSAAWLQNHGGDRPSRIVFREYLGLVEPKLPD